MISTHAMEENVRLRHSLTRHSPTVAMYPETAPCPVAEDNQRPTMRTRCSDVRDTTAVPLLIGRPQLSRLDCGSDRSWQRRTFAGILMTPISKYPPSSRWPRRAGPQSNAPKERAKDHARNGRGRLPHATTTLPPHTVRFNPSDDVHTIRVTVCWLHEGCSARTPETRRRASENYVVHTTQHRGRRRNSRLQKIASKTAGTMLEGMIAARHPLVPHAAGFLFSTWRCKSTIHALCDHADYRWSTLSSFRTS